MISSFSNPLIKHIRKLRDRKYRRETDSFFIEGSKFVGEGFYSKWEIEKAIYSIPLVRGDFGIKLLQDLANDSVELEEVTPEIYKHLVVKENIQGIGAIFKQKHFGIEKQQVRPGELWIALDEVQDPGNLGTILRTSDAVGAKGVILLDQSTDPYDPTSMRASMGAFFSQIIISSSLAQFANWKKTQDISVIGTSGYAREDYHAFRYTLPIVLLMGSERQGLTEDHLSMCDAIVKIPMKGRSDSLNLAIATGVILYEIFNQVRDRAGKG